MTQTQKKQEYILTEREIVTLYEESLRKYKNMVGICNPIYQRLKNQTGLEKREVQLMEETAMYIINEKRDQKDRVLNNELERIGFQVKDPYYIACVKPLSPLIYHAFFKRGQTSNDVDNRFSIHGINEGFEQIGGNAHHKFKRKFGVEGRRYYQRLHKEGVLEKFPNASRPTGEPEDYSPSNKHLPKSWIMDYLNKMRKTSQKHGYNDLIEVK